MQRYIAETSSTNGGAAFVKRHYQTKFVNKSKNKNAVILLGVNVVVCVMMAVFF